MTLVMFLPTGSHTMTEHELRCGFKLHGIVREDGLLEVKCHSKLCASELSLGDTVFHYFNPNTGELVHSRAFSDPAKLFPHTQQGA